MAEDVPRHAPSSEPGGAGATRHDAAAPGAGSAAGSAPPSGKAHGSFFKELPIILVAALVLSLLIKTFLVQAFFIPSGSMEKTLLVGDRVFVSKITTRFNGVHRGDVVVFQDPGGWLDDQPKQPQATGVAGAIRNALEFVGIAPAATGDDLIKRVIGVGGDTVKCCDSQGRVTVNGTPLDEPYVYPGEKPSEDSFSQKVPEGKLWVMGDHRSVSEDSRRHLGLPGGGFVPVDHVIGKAFIIVWPFNRFGLLHKPSTFHSLNGS